MDKQQILDKLVELGCVEEYDRHIKLKSGEESGILLKLKKTYSDQKFTEELCDALLQTFPSILGLQPSVIVGSGMGGRGVYIP